MSIHIIYTYIHDFIKELYMYLHLSHAFFRGLGHAAVSWKDLGGLATRWLFSVRKAVGEPEGKTESQFAEEVSQAREAPGQGRGWNMKIIPLMDRGLLTDGLK